ncbi:MAG TPA: hypothetical protein VHE61_15565 [Opitutaceae bacterium]|nr:hypothetical protein [Opitutaceae bacterium]
MAFPSSPVCLALLFALLPVTASAQASVAVNAAQTGRTVDDRVFGVNAVMWDPQLATSQTISLVNAAGLRFIRIPGGSVSDEYHWRVNRSLNNTWSWSSGMDAFAAVITGTNAQATAVVNYGTGTPEEAAAWVAYANAPANLQGTTADVALGVDSNGTDWHTAGYWSALRAAAKLATDDGSNFLRLGRSAPIGIKYWEIGNECYGTWETDQQAVPHDPYTYANRAKTYIAKMKAVDPTIKIGAVAVTGEDSDANNTNHPATNPRTGVVHNGWTPVMLATFKSLGVTPDFLIYHRYDQTPGQETDAGLLQAPRTWPQDAASLRQQLTDYLGAAGAPVELIVTENNSVFSNPGKQSTSVVNGLFYADDVGEILQTEFAGYMWWALRNGTPTSNGAVSGNVSASLYGWRQYGDYGIISTPLGTGITGSGNPSYYDPYPVYYMMKLLSHFARGGDTVVSATSSTSLLTAYAVKRTDGTLTLLLINKSPTADTPAAITFSGFVPGPVATVYTYGTAQDDAERTGSGTNDVATSTTAVALPTFSYTVPHYSAVVMSFTRSAPQIIVPPAAVSTGTGARVVFSVVSTGAGTNTYQWMKDGNAIAGATSATLALAAVTPADAGNYAVVIQDATGTAITSSSAALTVSAAAYVPPAATLFNISSRAEVGTSSNVMVAGFTIGGQGAKTVLIRAVGPGLAQYGLGGTLVDPELSVTTLTGEPIAANNDWGTWNDPATIAAAASSVGAFALQSGSKDSALIVTLPPGSYTATVQGANGTTGIALIEVYDLDPTSTARLTNVSTRAVVGTDDQQLIAGFVVRGGSEKLLVRAVGPGLAQYGVGGTLIDPQLAIKKLDGTVLLTNDNWEDANGGPTVVAESKAVGAFDLQPGSTDAAVVTSLPAANYTPAVTGAGKGTGVALVEVYEAP